LNTSLELQESLQPPPPYVVSQAFEASEKSSTEQHFAKPAPNLGRHLLAEFFDCTPNVLNNNALVEQLMTEAAVACGATIVQSCFHHFNPYGVSGVIVIAESHLTIHTWPEYGYASVDLYTCGDQCDPALAFNYLQDKFKASESNYLEFARGLMNPTTGKMMRHPARQVGSPTTRQVDFDNVTPLPTLRSAKEGAASSRA
jgi:S-adenosylmethionine decarboxylase proenzyme